MTTALAATPAATEAAMHVLDALATAFGGWSQFSDETAAAVLLAERWEDCGVEVEPTRSAIAAGFAAARARVSRVEGA